jgi:hypothetical protein
MKEIKPTYVTFEQAKWLKEKGFNEPCDSIYKEDGEFQSYKNFGDIRTHFKNSEPINPKTWHRYDTSAPEQWQVVEWLRINHGIWIWVENYPNEDNFTPQIPKANLSKILGYYKSPQEAYSAAFDYIKDNNLI